MYIYYLYCITGCKQSMIDLQRRPVQLFSRLSIIKLDVTTSDVTTNKRTLTTQRSAAIGDVIPFRYILIPSKPTGSSDVTR